MSVKGLTRWTGIAAAALAGLLTAISPVAAAPAASANSAEGIWQATLHHGVVQIFDCGEALCGRVITSDVLRTSPNLTDVHNKDEALRGRLLKGLVILKGFTGGPTEWKNGEVYNPEDGNTYHGMIELVSPDKLKLTGCVVFPFCRTQTWTRIQ